MCCLEKEAQDLCLNPEQHTLSKPAKSSHNFIKMPDQACMSCYVQVYVHYAAYLSGFQMMQCPDAIHKVAITPHLQNMVTSISMSYGTHYPQILSEMTRLHEATKCSPSTLSANLIQNNWRSITGLRLSSSALSPIPTIFSCLYPFG